VNFKVVKAPPVPQPPDTVVVELTVDEANALVDNLFAVTPLNRSGEVGQTEVKDFAVSLRRAASQASR
jgi:hypothetical protein